MTKNLICLTIIFLVSLVLSLPLLKPGFYTVHDDQQFARLFEFDKSIKSGQIPPRWVQDLGFGFGYPLFVFYPPLVYYLGEALHLLGFGYIDSIKIVFAISIFGSALAMYILVKELWGKYAALVSSLFYIMAPYRALDIYVRGALAEAFSFVWLPLILWSFYKMEKTKTPTYILLSGLFLALLMVTHNLIFLPFMLIFPFFILYLFLKSDNKKSFFLKNIFAFAFALGLSAFFWIPSLFEKKFTIVDQLLLVNLASYKIHFVYPQQLWNWPWGFGGSAPGLADGISFKIGKIHIVSSLVAACISIALILKSRTRPQLKLKNQYLIIVIFILFIFSTFMTTFYSQFIWDLLTPLGYLQFPWRFLTFSVFFASILAGGLIYLVRLPIVRLLFSILIITALIFPNLKLFEPQQYRVGLTDQIATSKETINWETSLSSFEYLPKGIDLYKNNQGANVAKISKTQVPKNRIEILSGLAQVDFLKNDPSHLSFNINSQDSSKIQANIFNFPIWRLKIDGTEQKINDNNPLKLIIFSVPPGNHAVDLEFKNTTIRNLANLITLTTFMLFVMLVIFRHNHLIKTKS